MYIHLIPKLILLALEQIIYTLNVFKKQVVRNIQSFLVDIIQHFSKRCSKSEQEETLQAQYEKERRRQRLNLIEYKSKLKRKIIEKELSLQQVDLLQDNKLEQIVQKPNQELLKQLQEIDDQLKEIDKEKQEIQQLNQQISKLEPDMVLIQGLEKKVIINILNYYEFQNRHIAGLEMNPETKKSLEIVHYHVTNSLPIKREIIYEVVPELFESEIGELDEYKRKIIQDRRPKLDNIRDTGVMRITEKVRYREYDDQILEFQSQEMEMMMFVLNKCSQFCDKREGWIQKRLDQGAPNFEAILETLEKQDPKTMSPEDLEVYNHYQELVKINNDYHNLLELNKIKVEKEQKNIPMPEFVAQHEILSKLWQQKVEQAIKYSFDFSESILMPRNSYESQLDQVLAKQARHDIQSLIEESENEIKSKFEGEMSIYDRVNKNDQLVKQVGILGEAMHQVDQLPLETQKQQLEKKFGDDNESFYKSQEGRILLIELPRLLFLNNKDPKTYNLQFWAEHFNIEPQKLRNIFNYIAYPLENNKILRFIL
ncbi:hypothetical protein pb186bvf_006004 [Paramecium bursaria]